MTFDIVRSAPKPNVPVTAKSVDEKVDAQNIELNMSLAEIFEKQESDKLENQLALAEIYEQILS